MERNTGTKTTILELFMFVGVNMNYVFLLAHFISVIGMVMVMPSNGHSKRGRKCTTYPDSIVKDLDLEPVEKVKSYINKVNIKRL